jgi:hypothetical protein
MLLARPDAAGAFLPQEVKRKKRNAPLTGWAASLDSFTGGRVYRSTVGRAAESGSAGQFMRR